MNNLTELLQEIPLDEMTGGLDMKISAENNNNTNGQDRNVKIKSKAPIAAAIAACAAIAVFGAVQLGNNVAPKPADKKDSSSFAASTSTDAEDSAKDEPEEDISLDDEAEKNYELTKLYYESNGFDIGLAANNIRLMDSKVGSIVKGFEGYDISVINTKCCYPFYSVDILVQRDGISEEAADINADDIYANWKVNGKRALGSFGKKDYGNVSIYTIYFEQSCLLYGDMTEDSDIEVSLFTHDDTSCLDEPERSSNLFTANFKAGELTGKDTNRFNNLMMDAGVNGKHTLDTSAYKIRVVDGELVGAEENETVDTEFTVNKISYSNCGIVAEINFTKGNFVDLDCPSISKGIIDNELNNGDSFIKLKMKDDPDHLVSVFNGLDLNRWNNGDLIWCDRYSGSSNIIWINLLNAPCDMSQVESIYFGTAEIKLPQSASAAASSASSKDGRTSSKAESNSGKSSSGTTTVTGGNNNTSSGNNTSNGGSTAKTSSDTSGKKTDTAKKDTDNDYYHSKEENEGYAKQWYNAHGADYSLIKGNTSIYDWPVNHWKVGSKDVDIWLSDVRASYPFYEFDVVMNADGVAEMVENETFCLGAYIYSASQQTYLHPINGKIYGDKVVFTAYLDISELDEDLSAGDQLSVTFDDCIYGTDGASYWLESSDNWVFPLVFTLGEDLPYDKNAGYDYHAQTDAKGKWDLQRCPNVFNPDEGTETIEYTINSVDWSNSKLRFNMKLDKEPSNFNVYGFGEELTTLFYDEEAIAKNKKTYDGFTGYYAYDPDRDYNFVKLEMSDGSIVPLDFYEKTNIDEEEDGTLTMSFNCIDYPFDADDVAAIHLGSAVVNVK